ncbi:MAG: rhomboid family intramembrane serine protease [Dysgonomonas sp.]
MKEYFRLLKISIGYAFFIVLIMWMIKGFEYLFNFNFYTFGIYPRTLDGLWGIITSLFLHGDFQHLIANTLPMFILSILLFFFYGKKSTYIFILLWLTSGIFTWVIGRSSWHIGASSLIYAIASFLIFGGILSKNYKLILISILVIIVYSGLIFGLFPTSGQVSWEGHLSGALSGLLWAYIFRKSLRRHKILN